MYYIIKLISLIHFQKMEIPVSSGKPEHQDIGTTTFGTKIIIVHRFHRQVMDAVII